MPADQFNSYLPKIFSVVRANWLNRELNQNAVFVAMISSLVIAFVSMLVWDDNFGLASKLKASSELVYSSGEYWRAWTSTFVHADFKHLLSNLFLFFILGWFLYGYFGALLFPVIPIVAGGVLNLLILLTYEPQVTVVGASGIVFFMGGLWLGLYFLIQRQQTVLQRVLRVGGIWLAMFMPSEAFDPAISYRTHFVGFGLGVVAATIYFFIHRSEIYAAEVREYVVEEPEQSLIAE